MAKIYLFTHLETENCDQYNKSSVIKSMQPYSTIEKAKQSVEESRFWEKTHEWIQSSETHAISNCIGKYSFIIEDIEFDDWIDNPIEEI